MHYTTEVFLESSKRHESDPGKLLYAQLELTAAVMVVRLLSFLTNLRLDYGGTLG